VTREEVWRSVADNLREGFGRLLDVRDVRRVRRVAGDAWMVTVVLAAPSGDLHVADLTVDDSGATSPTLGADHVIDAVKRAERASHLPAAMPDELADFGGGLDEPDADSGSELGLLSEIEEVPIEARVAAALQRGDKASLDEARELLPRMLADHDRRGVTLLTMAAVEMKVEEPMLARGYLEASAREFADRFDLDSLEKAAVLAIQLLGHEGFAGSPVHTLLEQSRTRLRPFARIFDTRSFSELPAELRARLAPHVHLRTLAPGDTLVAEGEPSRNVFVVKSGLVGVWLEKPSGGQWLVRCCFPGWLLGESSVLGPANAEQEPKCMATLRAERVSEVWTVSAEAIRAIMDEDLAFGQRIAETKQIHRIDSFFSMHETMGQLDVQVRDEMLSCIQRLETFNEQTLLLPANEIPRVACLVARGSIALVQDGNDATPVAVIEADSFYGVRDTIHRIAPSVAAIARPGTTVAFFEGTRLQKLCERSAEHVVAVLERLG
jgi:CRP-like cAMP-binding protein